QPLPELQLALLRAAAERVKPGGHVVYSVCTLNADENETIVDASGLEPDDLGADWPQFRHPKRPEFLLTTPHRHGTSGFFIARLRVGRSVRHSPPRRRRCGDKCLTLCRRTGTRTRPWSTPPSWSRWTSAPTGRSSATRTRSDAP